MLKFFRTTSSAFNFYMWQLFLLSLPWIIYTQPFADEVKNLLGMEKMKINYKQYSGYLRVSESHYLHYW